MAGKQRTYTQEQKQQIENILDKLPEKPKAERPLSTTELVVELRAKIRAAQAKGYTLDEIVQQFKQAGAQISLSTIKSSLKNSAPKRTKSTQTNEPQPTNNKPDSGTKNAG